MTQESSNQTKSFIKQEFDKFNQTTITTSIPMSQYRRTTIVLVDREKQIGSFSAGIRQVKKPETVILAFDVHYEHSDWIFLREGKMSFVIDNENFTLDAVDTGTDVITGEGVVEDTSYIIEPELLEKIGISEDFSMRISSSKGYIDIDNKNAQLFKTMCKQFYNNVFDQTKFVDALQTSVLPKDQKSSSGCFIATATMGNYNHPVVLELRQFRDNWLLKREWGINFTKWYYKEGPKAARIIEKSYLLRKVSFIFIIKPLQLITKKLK